MIEKIRREKEYILASSIIIAAGIISSTWIYTTRLKQSGGFYEQSIDQQSSFESISILPKESELPIKWENLGAQLIKSGVLDAEKIKSLYLDRGDFTNEYEELLFGQKNGKIKITEENAGYILNLFWALGIGNTNVILDSGPMSDEKYGGAGGFASTGGWILATGDPMEHYSMHHFVDLTDKQQKLVEKVAQNIYRPCCDNPTYFPDCNHGMAMLGMLELMASQGATETEMYKTALTVNSYWFPGAYTTIAIYLNDRGIDWSDVNPKDILSAGYSSASGLQRVSQEIEGRTSQSGGGGCSV